MTIRIGVMDSGAGGLTILQSIHAAIPQANLIYFADQANAPYGQQTSVFITRRLIEIADYFIAQGCQMMVIACNTATVAGITELRQSISIPVVGVEPAVKPACSSSICKRITVLATQGTSISKRLNDLIDTWRFDTDVEVLASSSLATLIDSMPTSLSELKEEVARIAEQVLSNKSDTLVLACTHYPLVKNLFDEILPLVSIVEPSRGVTAQVQRLIDIHGMSLEKNNEGGVSILTNGSIHLQRSLSYWINSLITRVTYIQI
ncbi:glutamate racemase [Marinomonas atlantica]|uniref:glutamate racemase n=1 Tax=Marinomonas atlantica TaxID=1806668 RepID=UPI000830DA5A|nr:glutamate racemase [Marinomonas atlantica]